MCQKHVACHLDAQDKTMCKDCVGGSTFLKGNTFKTGCAAVFCTFPMIDMGFSVAVLQQWASTNFLE